jgi:hypothetical protein
MTQPDQRASPALAPFLLRIPEGYSEGMFEGHRYRLEKTSFNSGRSVKFYARALDGTDFVSLNLYLLASGEAVKPCEMLEGKVRAFLMGVAVL